MEFARNRIRQLAPSLWGQGPRFIVAHIGNWPPKKLSNANIKPGVPQRELSKRQSEGAKQGWYGEGRGQAGQTAAEKQARQEAELGDEERIRGEVHTLLSTAESPGVPHTPAEVRRAEQTFPMKQQIETRAYDLYTQRGSEHGHDLDNWLVAENEIKQQ